MEDSKQNHNYEIMYIVDDQNQEKAQLIKKELYDILTENGGKIIKEEDAVRKFAYEINKKIKGHYFIVEVLTSPKNIANFNRVALIKQKQLEVIRFLVINLDSEKINKFKPKRQQVETNNYSRVVKSGNSIRAPYNREESAERKPRPIAGTENSNYRPRNNYTNTKTTSAPSTDKKD